MWPKYTYRGKMPNLIKISLRVWAVEYLERQAASYKQLFSSRGEGGGASNQPTPPKHSTFYI